MMISGALAAVRFVRAPQPNRVALPNGRLCLRQARRPAPSRFALGRLAPISVLASAAAKYKNAREAIESSGSTFNEGRVEEALEGFLAALEMRPNDDEARAAHYNAACCYTKLGQWEEAADNIITATNKYDLKFMVAVKDPDLQRLRERPEFDRVVSESRGGLTQEQYVKIRQEARSPFMLARTIILGGLSAGAGLGLLFIVTRLIAALKGGPGAPDLQESLQNLGINSGVLAVLVLLLIWDSRKKDREMGVIEREESLGKLLVQVNGERTATLQTLRGIARPVIIAGTRSAVQKAMKSAEPYRNAIAERGIELVPVVLNKDDPADRIAALKAELAADEGSKPQGFSKAARKAPVPDGGRKGKKYNVQVGKKVLAAVNTDKWEEWLNSVKAVSGVKEDNTWVQVKLDGSIRASGVGSPPWENLMKDTPPLDDIRSKLMN
mmetsp:Transcript_28966/g.81575  ORF Transcript_28966/g.81575 Transcript_28966/m.81575 type:complete len:439 (+) Transcript_28966:185-1501(+)